MATYECSVCGMGVNASCAKCDAPLVHEVLKLDELAKIMRRQRMKNGAISFDKVEVKFNLDEQANPTGVYFKTSKDANKLIEEFMLKANQVVAEHVFWLNLPFIYRVHDKPKEEKIERLLRMTAALGYKVRGKSEISNLELQKLLKQNYVQWDSI